MITLFVGDNDEGLSGRAKLTDPGAFLVNYRNWQKIVDQKHDKDITIYTSLSDLPKINKDISVLWNLITVADKIFYYPPSRWSDDTGNFSWNSQKILTEYYLAQVTKSGKTVIGLDLDEYKNPLYLKLATNRTNDSRSLWIAGCSVSHGVGVDISQRYGEIIGHRLSIPTYHLTQGGSSLEWAADQILRSDIRSGDILVWGLTQETRAPFVRNGSVLGMNDNLENIDYRLDETRYYKAITSVFQVINFCEKIGCRLILLPIICSEKLQMDILDQSVFYLVPHQIKFLDVGTDGTHPGPKQHQFWADFCLDIIKQNNNEN